MGERFGNAPFSEDATVPGGIWLHAVSVGEVLSSIELLRQLRSVFPSQRLYVSVTTLAGRQVAQEKLGSLADSIFYVPIDLSWAVRRVLRRLKPQVMIVMETEIWPNLYCEAKRFGCGLLVVNGRISDKAFPRYQRFDWFFRAVLRWPDAVLAQTQVAADRYRALGARRVSVAGNLKYDFRAAQLQPPPLVGSLLQRLQPSHVWIAASTMPPAAAGDPDEDDAVIDAFLQLAPRYPRLLLLLAPRRPERFDAAAEKLFKAGVPFLRRSKLDEASALLLPGVLVVDSMGELSALFPMADVVFMGGTLAQRGGHNILEPAFFSKTVITGPHMENFPEIAAEFVAGGGVYPIEQAADLATALDFLLTAAELRTQIGERAKVLAEARRGATERAVEAVRQCFMDALPRHVHPWPAFLLLWPLTWLWRWGAAIDRRRKLARQGRLRAPVITIGGIALGGTGKTPLVAYLSALFHERGKNPAILTRGYRRATPEKSTLLPPGAHCPVARTGDEAQILLRTGTASLGIGADRLSIGRQVEDVFQPGVILLDDGFQHWRLHRTVDLVLLDALDPFAGGAVFPLGRMRETRSALARASAFIITRACMPLPWRGLEKELARLQPAAPVFYSRTVPEEWVEWNGKARYPAAGLPPCGKAAFCGIGNPASFYATLHELRIEVDFRWTFADHEPYRARHLRRLAAQARAAGATMLLTTEKDVMNLPMDAERHIGSLPLFWLRTGIQLEPEEDFLAWLDGEISRTGKDSPAGS
ncbi:MAG TPA: tetraacyldisaccharide 4'-kinase [Bryobacteraceae bacterium]|nr:tetraacyldisaccharide 4'-kinase [Bryobacteraceae bacterium]